MEVSKQVLLRLFFNKIDNTFYVQLGTEMFFRVTDKVATAIQQKEKIEIVHAEDIRDMQIKSNEQ
jgi:hypothetical protein